MEQKAGAQITSKAFIQSLLILFVFMMATGILTRIIPAGQYDRITQQDRQLIDPRSFRFVARPDYPVWRWFTAPLEVLGGPDNLTIIVIIVFLLMVGGSFAVLDKSGILVAAIGRLVQAFRGRKYLLLLAVTLFFMSLGAFFGVFEEIVPLVPIMLALSYYLGWDSLVGLGMSVLATNLGFSAAITNPFTIGVAQKLAGLPLFSGTWFRLPIFIVVYAVLAAFLVSYARRIERDPHASAMFERDQTERAKYRHLQLEAMAETNPRSKAATGWFLVFLSLILLLLIVGPVLPPISEYALPLMGVLFLIGGVGAGWLSGLGGRLTGRALVEGITGIAPSIPLILMAASIKYIAAQGGIMDTILHGAARPFSQSSPFLAVLLVYVLALLIEFFVASGSAKAFLLMPILLPLADLVGVTRQLAVTAYCFGDGFSNLAYPTNPVLLICLGLTAVSYPTWLRWTLKLWAGIGLVTLIFLGAGVAIGVGPF